ncbi:MAG: hypothetical protein ACMUEL_03765 [Flavobacteriales bacterium Tduv]
MGTRTCFWQYKVLVWIRKHRYKGLARMYAQTFMKAIVHNLYRAPGIIMRCP